jgi:hypothetical protein
LFRGRHHQAARCLFEIGDPSACLKYNVNTVQPFVIGGSTPANPLAALIVGYYEGDKLMFASKMRNGFVPRSRREVEILKRLQTDGRPFANLPGKKCTQSGAHTGRNEELLWLY